jgi:acyl-CoA synthetase (AMP-forming)/AMP-acid ligase II
MHDSLSVTTRVSTLVELLRLRSQLEPDQLAYKFLVDGETDEIDLSYGELDQQARVIGAYLQKQVARGDRVLLLFPAGLEFIAAFFGCLYAGLIAVPVYSPRSDRTLDLPEAIANDAEAKTALTTTSLFSTIETRLANHSSLQSMHWITTDNITGVSSDSWLQPEIADDCLAFLQYTSGSTSTPKGVMVSHRNILYNERLLQQVFEHTEQTKIVIWLPLSHDMGLIGNVLQSLYVGVPCILMSPLMFVQKPRRWLEAISRYGATTSGAPNFAYDLCIRKITPEQRSTLDLSSWRVAFNAAEPVRAKTIEQFTEVFAPCGFRAQTFLPCYGLAEATLIVSGGKKDAVPIIQGYQKEALEKGVARAPANGEQVRTLVGCGPVLGEQEIVIVDPESVTTCESNHVGEIWISGPSVSEGYWNRVELTEKTFKAYLADTGQGPYLRTGDLGFLAEGELFITDRLKDLIIIRGQNYSPVEIEWKAEESHPALRSNCGAAFTVNGDDGEEHLVLVHELARESNSDPEEIKGAIRQSIAEYYGLRVYDIRLLMAGTVPRTTSGKIQRQVCRAGFLNGTLKCVPLG